MGNLGCGGALLDVISPGVASIIAELIEEDPVVVDVAECTMFVMRSVVG
jgi:hypothetical protein